MACFQSSFNYFYAIAIFLFFHTVRKSVCLDNYVPSEVISLSCGSFGPQIQSYDGRNWTGDVRTQFVASNSAKNSTISTAYSMDPSIPQLPYMTARLFHSKFTYTFNNVTPGPKFIRLFFNPNSSYSEFNVAESFLTVTSGHFTLLRNFSAFLTANYIGKPYFFKEFIIQVENPALALVFTPSSNAPGAHAFLNGIELVSMPPKLYINEKKILGMAGYPSVTLTLDNTTALETAYRVNMGGDPVSPKQDTGMLRTWTADPDYIFGSAFGEEPYDLSTPIRYPATPEYTAPESVYRTARSMSPNGQVNLNYNLSWFFQVDTGFLYLVRLHFCEISKEITKGNQRVFDVFINNETAVKGADIILWAGGYGIPVYKDYVVRIPTEKVGAVQDLWLELHPNMLSRSQYSNALLNGAEIFKMSDFDGNLAGIVPSLHGPNIKGSRETTTVKASWKSKRKVLIITGCLFSVVIVVLSVALRVRKTVDGRKVKEGRESLHCHQFSIAEMKAATDNFDKARVIGSGGFGVVYKGDVDGGKTTVAIKRGNQASKGQGCCEFNTEIATLSHLRHYNILSLIGYCPDDHEMILVYEYMPNGSLFDHLHLVGQPQKPPLSWKQRLEICLGAAQGLHYLHSGTEQPIIHRDIKSTNILIDENWVAKVSDFGLCKVCPAAVSNNPISTSIKGSIGYMDPEYYRHCTLTNKSDVYSFGVVLLEVLSARLVVNPTTEENNSKDGHGGDEQESLVEWALSCLQTGETDPLIDPNLRGTIKPPCLTKFLELIRKCLAPRCGDRPCMSEVVGSLELALQLVGHNDSVFPPGDQEMHIDVLSNPDVKMLGENFSQIMMPMGR